MANESKKVFYSYDWDIVEAADKYGFMERERKMMTEGVLDKLKELGKGFMKFLRSNTQWFRRAAPKLSSIATEAESLMGTEDFM